MVKDKMPKMMKTIVDCRKRYFALQSSVWIKRKCGCAGAIKNRLMSLMMRGKMITEPTKLVAIKASGKVLAPPIGVGASPDNNARKAKPVA